jgi:hypothetical protein
MTAPGITAPAAESIPLGWLPPCDATATGAEAGQVQFARGARVLVLCGHHAAGHWLALIAAGWCMTRDDRPRLAA